MIRNLKSAKTKIRPNHRRESQENRIQLGLSIPKGEPSGLPTYTVDGNGYDVGANEKLIGFLELQTAIHEFAVSLILWAR
jgi:hypothetical protein